MAGRGRFVPAPDKVPPLEVLGQRLRRCEADEGLGVEGVSETGGRWPGLDIPG